MRKSFLVFSLLFVCLFVSPSWSTTYGQSAGPTPVSTIVVGAEGERPVVTAQPENIPIILPQTGIDNAENPGILYIVGMMLFGLGFILLFVSHGVSHRK